MDLSNINEDIDEAANLKMSHFKMNLHNDLKFKQNVFYENDNYDIEDKEKLENYKI